MLAVVETWAEDGSSWQDNTLLYLYLMLFKVGLNTLTLGLCCHSLRRSFMGLSGVSVCLADLLLLCGTAYIWLFRPHIGASASLCFLLTHASTIYSLLPLPFLLLGALDYSRNLNPSSRPMSPQRACSCCILILFIWALACLYSYYYTDSEVVLATPTYDKAIRVCTVENSSLVFYFCLGAFLTISCVLLYYSQRAPKCLRAAVRLSKQWDMLQITPHCDLPFSHRTGREAQLAAQGEGLPEPPLLLRFTLGFSLSWTPFLAVNLACRLLNLATPSYMTVNLLWLLCANSVLIGAVLWSRRQRPGPCGDPPDDTCTWSVYRLENGGGESRLQEKLSEGIYTLSSRDTDKLLHV